MKKLFLYLLIMIVFPLASTAQIQKGVWQQWKASDCYKNLYYRIKLAGINGTTLHWQVQLKNKYPQIISFNYFFTDDQETTDRFTKRKTMQKNEISKPFDLYFQKKELFVSIDKLSLSPFPDIIEPCDNIQK